MIMRRFLSLLIIAGACYPNHSSQAQTASDTATPIRYPAAGLNPALSAQRPATPLPRTPLPATQPTVQVAGAAAVGTPLAQVASLPTQPAQPGGAGSERGLIGPPFQITPIEQQFVDQILQMWENESTKINTFSSRFELWEYDLVFGPGAEIPAIKSVGQLTYSKPDKGSFKIEEIRRYQPKDATARTPTRGLGFAGKRSWHHWVCDGKAVYEYKHKKKQLVVQPLPPELQGQEIVNGPLPFLFGAKAAELNRRYWIRSKQGNPATIWLEAYPRSQADAANYHHVEIMLDRKSMQPEAIKVHSPNNQSHSVYMFDKPTINGKLNALLGGLFNAPRTPFGWTKVVQNQPDSPQAGPQAAVPQPTTQR